MVHNNPLVSIGLPVYNGEKLINRVLDSLLSQTYQNLEIIISDDASTDNTAQICRDYASKDKRIIFFLNKENRGSIWNHNRVFELSKGKYFTWVSQDDLRAPQFISKCIEKLEMKNNAVLCHTYTGGFIDNPENILILITHDTLDGIISPIERYITAMKSLPASAIESVFRTDILRHRKKLFEYYISSDIVLTRELTLYGEFLQVPEMLSLRSARYARPTPKEDYAVLTGGKKMSLIYLPFVVLLYNHVIAIARSPISFNKKGYLWIKLLIHELKTLFLKILFRFTWFIFNSHIPKWILNYTVSAFHNPNIHSKRDFQDLPVQLQPGWLLLNHRNIERSIQTQNKIIKILEKKIKNSFLR